jgi:magnesium-protoporphyrin O-methyltransferase
MVEASPAYLEVARREVGSRYGSRPTQFILGDFAAIADTVPKADVVTLDRVVCCYPDGEALLRKAAERTLHLFAFTYPRDRWYVRMMIALENFWRRLTGSKFRAFVHPPKRMEAMLEAAGLVRDAQRETLVWVFELYSREAAI